METIETHELEVVKQETDQMIAEAKALAVAIKDPPSYKLAGEFWLKAKAMEKRIKAYFKPVKDAMNKAKQEVLDKEDAALRRALECTAILGPAIGAYEAEQERIRLEMERKAQAEARRLEEEARIAAAVAAEQAGSKEEAEEILATPAPVAPVTIQKQKFESEVGKIHTREDWKAELVNMRELLKGIMDGVVPITAVEVNTTVLNQAARANKDQAKWPGVRFFKTVIRVGMTS